MKNSSLICIIISIACQAALSYIYFSLDADKLLQGIAAKSMMEGHGLTIPQVHVSDLSKVSYEKLNGWPPAYSIMIGPLYLLFDKSLISANLFLATLFFTSFIILLYKILRFLQFPTYLCNLMVLFYGCGVGNYLQQSLATDLPAMFFCIWSCYLLSVFITNTAKSASFGWLPGIAGASASTLRYMYLATGVVVPILLIWNGWFKKDRRLLLGGYYSLAAVVIITGGMLVFQYSYTGYFTYTKPTTQGLFFSNLQYIHPFILTVFINFDFYFVQLSSFLGIQYSTLQKALALAGFPTLVAFLYVIIKKSVKNRLVMTSGMNAFFITASALSLSIVTVLCYLTVKNSAWYDAIPPFMWVYVSEGRYFISAQIFISIFLTWWLFVRPVDKHAKLVFILRRVFLLLITIEILHGSYLITKYLVLRTNPLPVSGFDKIKTVVKKLAHQNQIDKEHVVFTSNKEKYMAIVSDIKIDVLHNITEIEHAEIRSSRPVLLIICLSASVTPYFKNFLSRHGINKVYEDNQFYLATYSIKPLGNQ